MPKQRVTIPQRVRNQVMNEYRHQCAICGKNQPEPHLHHIDEDPANNDPQNLLPLCPNHHLKDPHDPTSPLDPLKLKLFRRFKDPTILGPKFDPLFARMRFLLNFDASDESLRLGDKVDELIEFLSCLEMASFYEPRIRALIGSAVLSIISLDTPEAVLTARRREDDQVWRAKIDAHRDMAISLIVELLRYQDWHEEDHPRSRD